MENQEIVRELLHEFKNSDLTALEMETADLKLRLGRGHVEFPKSSDEPLVARNVPAAEKPEHPENPVKEAGTPEPAGKSEEVIHKENSWAEIKAPLVGTFYAAPSPEDEPYVKEGQKVAKGDTLCILEAMKMMNELTAPYDLVVRNILGVNGEMAEYDQVLFEVEKC